MLLTPGVHLYVAAGLFAGDNAERNATHLATTTHRAKAIQVVHDTRLPAIVDPAGARQTFIKDEETLRKCSRRINIMYLASDSNTGSKQNASQEQQTHQQQTAKAVAITGIAGRVYSSEGLSR